MGGDEYSTPTVSPTVSLSTFQIQEPILQIHNPLSIVGDTGFYHSLSNHLQLSNMNSEFQISAVSAKDRLD